MAYLFLQLYSSEAWEQTFSRCTGQSSPRTRGFNSMAARKSNIDTHCLCTKLKQGFISLVINASNPLFKTLAESINFIPSFSSFFSSTVFDVIVSGNLPLFWQVPPHLQTDFLLLVMETPSGAVNGILLCTICSTSSSSSTEANSIGTLCSFDIDSSFVVVMLWGFPSGPGGLGRSLNFLDLHFWGERGNGDPKRYLGGGDLVTVAFLRIERSKRLWRGTFRTRTCFLSSRWGTFRGGRSNCLLLNVWFSGKWEIWSRGYSIWKSIDLILSPSSSTNPNTYKPSSMLNSWYLNQTCEIRFWRLKETNCSALLSKKIKLN